MGKKAKIVIVSLILISSLVVGSVSAFYKGEIDGQWGVIDSVQGSEPADGIHSNRRGRRKFGLRSGAE